MEKKAMFLVSQELLQKCLNLIAEAPVAFKIVLPIVQEIERLQPYVKPKEEVKPVVETPQVEAPSTNC
jgi:hypothetical protein